MTRSGDQSSPRKVTAPCRRGTLRGWGGCSQHDSTPSSGIHGEWRVPPNTQGTIGEGGELTTKLNQRDIQRREHERPLGFGEKGRRSDAVGVTVAEAVIASFPEQPRVSVFWHEGFIIERP